MQRLTIEYGDGYMPKELCSMDRYGDADDCDTCCEYCRGLGNIPEDEGTDCGNCAIDRCFTRLGIYENAHEKIEKRLQEIKGSTECPHNFTGQMAEDLEWVLKLLTEDCDCGTEKGAEDET